ncbi:helix-turn-helix domain-containing protein [Synechocystis salina LEGE 06099]|nr:helix-turn-helix domain-containing protein [Synechocystis salina LEGE 06099]
MKYLHLSIGQRNRLYRLQQEQKFSQRELVLLIRYLQSAIYRELRRNKTEHTARGLFARHRPNFGG